MAPTMRRPALAMAAIAGLGLTATTAVTATAGTAAGAERGAAAGGTTTLWVTHQYVTRRGFNLAVAADPDGSAVFVAGEVNRQKLPGRRRR
jgi:outer membrane lipoprotein SlyB